ncbi:choice-of-anchor H family protein [Shewanella gaetbuli]|uniref:Choice-of-anchor H family protein n=1 Tax=Shewanella gaetbuli TaxID=220752 RepID=A0A9X1ZIS9_9GAMM|nr:choice-of-anchor H family protein [Shewanella gaetbuli]MCL1141747.1 choice-of-anchor H family protein [Shewanella gaetbuli]
MNLDYLTKSITATLTISVFGVYAALLTSSAVLAEPSSKTLPPLSVSEGHAVNQLNGQDLSASIIEKQIETLKQMPQNQINTPNKITERDQRIKAYQQGEIAPPDFKATQLKQGIQSNVVQARIGYRDFVIYDAFSRLFDDFNGDGYYHSFSVTFDADVYGFTVNDPADVYAEMYLSRNGGPWEHYHTTDVFTIYGESDEDDFEVITTLAQGYKTDYYDVLIDLYEYGYPEVVATLSADESDGLYALPLQSRDRDIYYEEEVGYVSAGGLSIGVLGLLLLLALMKRGMPCLRK